MLLFKSFWSKKSTIISTILIFSVCVFIFIIKNSYNIYVDYINDEHKYSYVEFKASPNEYEGIINIENINYVELGLYANAGKYDSICLVFPDYNNLLKENEIIGSPRILEKYNIGDTFKFLDIDYEFVIKEKEYLDYESFLINSNTFNKLYKNEDKILYKAYLDDWTKKNDTIKEINNNSNFEMGYFIEVRNDGNDMYFHTEYLVMYFLLLVIIASLSIIFVYYVIISTWNEESKLDEVYYYTGFTKRKIFIYKTLKLLNVFIISLFIFIISLIIVA